MHLPDRKSSRYRFEHATTWLDKIASTHKECLARKWHGDTLVRKYVYRKFELARVTGSRIIAQALNPGGGQEVVLAGDKTSGQAAR